jgi:uncharacterized coiled-coil protein SlyX
MPEAIAAANATGAIVAGEIAAIKTEAAIAVESAEERAAAAQAAARQLADAALTTELGRMITDTRKEVDTWRAEMQGQVNQLLSSQEALTSQLAELAAKAPPVTVVTVVTDPPAVPQNLSSTPPASEPVVTATVVQPETIPVQSGAVENPAPETARKRFRLI